MLQKIFPGFEKPLLDDIERLSTPRNYDIGKSLLRKGEKIPGVFIIVSGFVKAYQQNDEGDEFVITYVGPADSFGISVSDESPAANKNALLGYKAIEPTKALLLPFSHKDALAKKYETWYRYVLQTAVQYYRSYLDLVDHIAFHKMDKLVEFFLKRLSEAKNSRTIEISHQEIAMGLSTSREVVSRLLKKLEAAGKISLEHNKIKILGDL